MNITFERKGATFLPCLEPNIRNDSRLYDGLGNKSYARNLLSRVDPMHVLSGAIGYHEAVTSTTSCTTMWGVPSCANVKRLFHALLFTDEGYYPILFLMCVGECVLNFLIIKYISCEYHKGVDEADTEIDFFTYLRQAQMFLGGERTYQKINPPDGSGPCVYPAGHLYIFAFFDVLTTHGSRLLPAQVAYAALYICTLILVAQLYRFASVPPIVLPFLGLSKRLHSIYVLRLFNDPVSMFFVYMCVYLLCRQRWKVACIFYS